MDQSINSNEDSVSVVSEHLVNPEGDLVPLQPFQEYVANLPPNPFIPQGESTESEAENMMLIDDNQYEAIREEMRRQSLEIMNLQQKNEELKARILHQNQLIQALHEMVQTLHQRLQRAENGLLSLRNRPN